MSDYLVVYSLTIPDENEKYSYRKIVEHYYMHEIKGLQTGEDAYIFADSPQELQAEMLNWYEVTRETLAAQLEEDDELEWLPAELDSMVGDGPCCYLMIHQGDHAFIKGNDGIVQAVVYSNEDFVKKEHDAAELSYTILYRNMPQADLVAALEGVENGI